MTTPVKLTGDERSAALASIPSWSEVEGRDAIQKKFHFGDFVQAWGFMSKVALEAEKVPKSNTSTTALHSYFISLSHRSKSRCHYS